MRTGHPNKLEPSNWVRRFSDLAQAPVLDLACGAGRHTQLFADRGLEVTALDRDLSGLGKLGDHPRITAIEADLETDMSPWRPKQSAFGTIVVTNYLFRPILPELIDALRPGGVLLYETFARGNEAFGKPSNPEFLLEPGELLDTVRDRLTVIAYEHGRVGEPRPAIVQRICAVQESPSLASSLPLDSSA